MLNALLTDLRMPGMGGDELIREARKKISPTAGLLYDGLC
jgi:CheY-like chemotaxis protein